MNELSSASAGTPPTVPPPPAMRASGSAVEPWATRPARVVILGAGFGGLYAALDLARRAGGAAAARAGAPAAGEAAGSGSSVDAGRDDRPVEVTLVDRSPRFVFKPLLYELLTDEVDEDDIAPPLDRVLPAGGVIRRIEAEVRAIDLAARTVAVVERRAAGAGGAGAHGGAAGGAPAHGGAAGDGAGASPTLLPWDALVIALGAEPASHGIPGIAEHAFAVASLEGFLRLRAHLDEVASRAAARGEGEGASGGASAEGERLRTVAIVGAGASGVETALKLADRFAGAPLPWRIVLVELAGSILPGFSAPMREAARGALAAKGVEVRLETAVAGASAYGLELAPRRAAGGPGAVDARPSAGGPGDAGSSPERRPPPPERLLAATVVWTAGTRPSAVVRDLAGAPRDPAGRLRCEPTLALAGGLAGLAGVFALGDCAAVVDGAGRPVPATAQAAVQQAAVVADNALRCTRGEPLAPFRYRHLGESLSLGRGEDAVAVGPVLVRGRLGSVLRRALYLARMPGFEHRLVVGGRWAARLAGEMLDAAAGKVYASRRAARGGG